MRGPRGRRRTAAPRCFSIATALWSKKSIISAASKISRLVPGAADVIGAANRRGIPVVLVTNQAGIGRGCSVGPNSWRCRTRFRHAGSARRTVGRRLCLPAPSNGKGDFLHPDHPARKPNPGMILRAATDLGLDLQKLLAGRRQDHRHRSRPPRGPRRRDAGDDRLWRGRMAAISSAGDGTLHGSVGTLDRRRR